LIVSGQSYIQHKRGDINGRSEREQKGER